MEFNQPEFGNSVKETRIRKNLSQTTLAEMLGVSAQAIWKWEKHDAVPRQRTVRNKVELWIDGKLIPTSMAVNLESFPTEVLAKELIRRGLKVSF